MKTDFLIYSSMITIMKYQKDLSRLCGKQIQLIGFFLKTYKQLSNRSKIVNTNKQCKHLCRKKHIKFYLCFCKDDCNKIIMINEDIISLIKMKY